MRTDPLSPADFKAYLQRLGFESEPEPDSNALAALHEAHLQAIPFENLDIPLGQKIRLDPAHLANKLVQRRRGGFCFEQNSLFAAALTSLGFSVRQQLARVWLHSDGTVRPRTHHVLLVEANGSTWLADVGFGGPGLRRPVPFEPERPVDQGDGTYRLRTEKPFGYFLERAREGSWEPLYSFDLDVCWPADFETSCHFAATHPESLFTNHLVATRIDEQGRLLLLDDQLTIEKGGAVTEKRQLDSPTALAETLETHFGLALKGEELQQLAEFAAR